MLAEQLAGLDDPFAQLCPHQPAPKPEPRDSAIPTPRFLLSASEAASAANAGASDQGSDDERDGEAGHSFASGSKQQTSDEAEPKEDSPGSCVNASPVKTQTEVGGRIDRIDGKSLVQALFNSTSWRLARSIESSAGAYALVPQALDDQSYQARQRQQHGTDLQPLSWGVLECVLQGLERSSLEKTAEQRGRHLFGRTTPFSPHDASVATDVAPSAAASEFDAKAFVAELFETPGILKSSFVEDPPDGSNGDGYETIEIKKMCTSFLIFYAVEDHPRFILPSLWRSLAHAYSHPSDPDPSGDGVDGAYSDAEAAHMINIALGALLACVFVGDASVEPDAWATFTTLRAHGRFLPAEQPADVAVRRQVVAYVAIFEDPLALRLMRRVLRVFASRAYRRRRLGQPPWVADEPDDFTARIVRFVASDADRSRAYGRMVLEWARTVFAGAWDGAPEVAWGSDAGAALEFMRLLHDRRAALRLEPADFALPRLARRVDFLDAPVQWLAFTPDVQRTHLLEFPWLFPPAAVVTFFRAVSYAAMFDAFASSVAVSTMVQRLLMLAGAAHRTLLDRLARATTSYLVLEIRRERILGDALDQLWRRQRRELQRPLKIRMGIDEGEEGVDLGGVQQEFFRLALGQALDPEYGLFAVDETTRMAWFVPDCKAPPYQLVLVGFLVGLAVYNGITLPVTFPLALYRKLLGWPVASLEDITDGWPVLSKGLRSLLDWDDGDVEDVFVRSYVFSGVSDGCPFNIDMAKHGRDDPWPFVEPTAAEDQPPSDSPDPDQPAHTNGTISSTDENPNAADDDAPMVTNANRAAYVADYVFWLTDKSVRPQYDAFATGFFLPLDGRALRLFDPSALRDVVEGFQDVDAAALERVARYENGFAPEHRAIRDFWTVVRDFSPDELRRLLEFVTASDRVPVKGVEEMTFLIQRNGTDDERLPTSMTCFGRLLLPEYSSRERLEQKLRHAIENSRGFGVA